MCMNQFEIVMYWIDKQCPRAEIGDSSVIIIIMFYVLPYVSNSYYIFIVALFFYNFSFEFISNDLLININCETDHN